MERWGWSQDSSLPFYSVNSQQPPAKRWFSWTVLEKDYLGEATKDYFNLMPKQSSTDGTILATCRPCAMFILLPKALTNYVCYKCSLISLLGWEWKTWGMLSMLQFIKEGEEFLGRRKVIDPRRNTENQKHLGNKDQYQFKKYGNPLHHVSHLGFGSDLDSSFVKWW